GHRHHDMESMAAQPFIVQRSMQPTRYKMTQVNLASVFKFVNNLANDTATAVRGHGRLEVNCPMGAVGTCKWAFDGAVEWFRTFLAKWRADANGFCFALIAKILGSSNACPTDCADRRIEKRYGRFHQVKLLNRDHISARSA